MNNIGATEKDLIEFRKKKLEGLKKIGIDPYPSESEKNITAKEILDETEKFISEKKEIVFAGRLLALRGHGKLIFADIVDESGKIQAVMKYDLLKSDFQLSEFLDLGDFIEVKGCVFKTDAGEISIEANKLRILTKTLRQLPEKHQGLKNEEMRLRKRYLEFATDPDSREIFRKKAKFWQSMRDFMIKKGFLEVETPALENTAGGADANPFVTHHDALDIDVFLRISMGELWQKRLMVGGFEKTFEIGKQFRNEGISREHLQDYTQLEFYWAYKNYEEGMKLVEELYRYVAKETFGTSKFRIGEFDIDLGTEWKKIDYTEMIQEKMGIDVLEASEEELHKKLDELNIEYEKNGSKGRLIDCLWKSIRKTIVGPVFLVNHPVEVSPLAKRKEDNPKLAERYQIILAGSEIGNGYSELNDPLDQHERFLEQAKLREAGDKEAQMNDADFVEALEYGMPPTIGFGVSERLFSFLANKSSRECVMFPLMKPTDQRSEITNNQTPIISK